MEAGRERGIMRIIDRENMQFLLEIELAALFAFTHKSQVHCSRLICVIKCMRTLAVTGDTGRA